jgi:hypothetical protein
MVGRLTRRIYIYGLDGLVGIPENFDRFAAYNMREIKQLHAASKKPAISLAEPCPPEASAVTSPPLRWSAANTLSEIPSRIQESNLIHQSFSGNQAVMGVTYPPGFGLAFWRLQPRADQGSTDKFRPNSARSHSAHRSSWQLFCLRDAVKFQIDGGCSAYD